MEIQLKFIKQELNLIMYALQKLPYETVHELIKNIVDQVNAIPDENKVAE